jgi:hypothetical protein
LAEQAYIMLLLIELTRIFVEKVKTEKKTEYPSRKLIIIESTNMKEKQK